MENVCDKGAIWDNYVLGILTWEKSIFSRSVVLKISGYKKHLQSLLMLILWPTPKIHDFLNLGCFLGHFVNTHFKWIWCKPTNNTLRFFTKLHWLGSVGFQWNRWETMFDFGLCPLCFLYALLLLFSSLLSPSIPPPLPVLLTMTMQSQLLAIALFLMKVDRLVFITWEYWWEMEWLF